MQDLHRMEEDTVTDRRKATPKPAFIRRIDLNPQLAAERPARPDQQQARELIARLEDCLAYVTDMDPKVGFTSTPFVCAVPDGVRCRLLPCTSTPSTLLS